MPIAYHPHLALESLQRTLLSLLHHQHQARQHPPAYKLEQAQNHLNDFGHLPNQLELSLLDLDHASIQALKFYEHLQRAQSQ